MADTNTVIMKELLGLFADVNPNEIAEHIADGTLADWCELWRQQATVAAENLRAENNSYFKNYNSLF